MNKKGIKEFIKDVKEGAGWCDYDYFLINNEEEYGKLTESELLWAIGEKLIKIELAKNVRDLLNGTDSGCAEYIEDEDIIIIC